MSIDKKRRGLLISGTYSSGKDDICDYLVENYGFVKSTFGGVVREVLEAEGLPLDSRDVAQRIGFEKRKQYGEDYWIKLVTEPLLSDGTRGRPFVVNGTRYVRDVVGVREYLNSNEKHAPLIWVDAPVESRYEWQMRGRRKRGDKVMSFEEFVRIDNQDRGIGETVWQQSESVKPLAAHALWNGGTEEEFKKLYIEVLRELKVI